MFFLEDDTWWHLAVAARILKTHSFPTHDIYSFTALGSPWIDYEWLGDMVLELFWKLGGLQGLVLFVIVLAGIVMVLVYYYASFRSGNSKAAFVACALSVSSCLAAVHQPSAVAGLRAVGLYTDLS